MTKYVVLFAVVVGVIPFSTGGSEHQTPIERHGKLRVENARIVDQHGNPVQLRGMSFFWSQWMGKFYNKQAVDWLADDWKVTIVRAAMGVRHEPSKSGYMYDMSEAGKIKTIVDAAIKRGIYVIIDWHDHYACKNSEASKGFFREMASRYGKHPNVIYEIFNEPVHDDWSSQVKPYSETIVKTIREVDPDNIILIGSPHWCQDIDISADDPVSGSNLAYSLHFYAASHGEDLRRKSVYAMQKGIALFASEFGTTLATGDGMIDSVETEAWFAFMDRFGISWCNWSIADKQEISAALVPGARPTGGWKRGDLTPSGRMIRQKCRHYAGVIEKEPARREKKKSRLTIKPVN
ncbi:MAG: glycoside hydrolase family 5 protein [Chitinispirillaceae bacterium]|nr:glycoside hydrolase family 5 protein [Chitinispirillaceae bacterium]